VLAHPADGIGLDHGINARGFEQALGNVRINWCSEYLNDNKVTVRHAAIIRRDGIADSRVGSPVSASSGGISISQNRSNSEYNPRLDLSHDAN
jgi:hypothetical protein